MDKLRLESYPCPIDEGTIRYHIFISDRNFIDIVRDVELPFAEKEGHPEMAGGYIGFSSWYLKECFNSFIEDGKMDILNCGGCGNEGCWPLVAEITTKGKTLVWSNFFNPHREPDSKVGHWDHVNLGPFVFDKEQYVTEFARVLKDLGAEIVPGSRRFNVYNDLE